MGVVRLPVNRNYALLTTCIGRTRGVHHRVHCRVLWDLLLRARAAVPAPIRAHVPFASADRLVAALYRDDRCVLCPSAVRRDAPAPSAHRAFRKCRYSPMIDWAGADHPHLL